MTTLLSLDEKNTINLKMKGYKLSDGDMLLVGSKEELDKAEKFIDEDGFGGIYFDPTGGEHSYTEYMFVANAIRLYN